MTSAALIRQLDKTVAAGERMVSSIEAAQTARHAARTAATVIVNRFIRSRLLSPHHVTCSGGIA